MTLDLKPGIILRMDWQALFFDFDGVVLDTTTMKTQAFVDMYPHEPDETIEQIVAYHQLHGGISRWVKFRHFERVILRREVSEEAIGTLAARYSERVVDRVIASPFVPGAEETLAHIRDTGVKAFVVSGTPHEELNHIVTARGLDTFFAEVHGSPRLKPVIIDELLQRHTLDPARCLFIGDAPTDYNAAKATGMFFLGIEPPGEKHLFPPGTHVSREVHIPCPEE